MISKISNDKVVRIIINQTLCVRMILHEVARLERCKLSLTEHISCIAAEKYTNQAQLYVLNQYEIIALLVRIKTEV